MKKEIENFLRERGKLVLKDIEPSLNLSKWLTQFPESCCFNCGKPCFPYDYCSARCERSYLIHEGYIKWKNGT